MERVAIVTGGGAGIGRAASHALARDGFAVLVADVNVQSAEDVADEIRTAQTGMAAAVTCDVSVEADWRRLLHHATELGQLEVLVSNAGIFPRLAFEQTSIGDFDRVMAINFRAAFLGASLSLPLMRESGGAFVMMTSGSGLTSAVANPMQRGFSLYGASKAGLDRWALGVAPEIAPFGVAINLLCPGAMVMTEGVSQLALGSEEPAEKISPERVADAIVHLAKLRPPEGTGRRYVATEFGTRWG